MRVKIASLRGSIFLLKYLILWGLAVLLVQYVAFTGAALAEKHSDKRV